MQIPHYKTFIESSDDTGIAVLRGGKVMSNLAKPKVHSRYGGVVPNYVTSASKQHSPTITLALEDAGIDPSEVDAVAYKRPRSQWFTFSRCIFC